MNSVFGPLVNGPTRCHGTMRCIGQKSNTRCLPPIADSVLERLGTGAPACNESLVLWRANSCFIFTMPGVVKCDSETSYMVPSGVCGSCFKRDPFVQQPCRIDATDLGVNLFARPRISCFPN